MIEQIKSMQDLYSYAKESQELLDLGFVKDDPEACLNRMTELEHIMSMSGKMLADAKYWQDEEQSKLKNFLKEVGSSVSTTTLNNYIKAKTKEQNYLVNWLDRVNRSATHMLENIRTAISYRKEELKNLNYGKA